ncbi:hypothetical protein PS664_01434 [Pseudomonas fluorescens]|nr:hypothetical protein PS664_01434 [Pseudomonas fluorescens]
MERQNERLLLNLVSAASAKNEKARGKVNFINAMRQLGIESVFDIIGQSKPQFIERLGEICDADGALAYDNAMCYAVQIGRLYREHRLSSGKPQHLTRRTGIRALTDAGPSYPNLFKENWDEFCSVGALAAIDSPVAYLRELYHFATRTLEASGVGIRPKIKLATRRPDIATLLIDQQSTFTPRPMLGQVNEVLKDDISRYVQSIPGSVPIYELLANRRHPFIFPYSFPHHQCRLGLAASKLQLGELNYRISFALPPTQPHSNAYGAVQTTPHEAQRLLSGLSPKQQQLLIEPSLFTTFYLSKANIDLNGLWTAPGTSHLMPHKPTVAGFLLRLGQPAVVSAIPPADALSSDYRTPNEVKLNFVNAGAVTTLQNTFTFALRATSNTNRYRLNYLHPADSETRCPCIRWESEIPFPLNPGYSATFTITPTAGSLSAPVGLAAYSVTVVLDEWVNWSTDQQMFWRSSYGLATATSSGGEELTELKRFMRQTELNAEQVEALLSQRAHFPRLSPNCPSTNPQRAGGVARMAYPHPSHYGACYVNGHGSDRYDSVVPATAVSIRRDQFDNSMGLREQRYAEGVSWYLTKTSPQRFDRLQRMIRLQRWLNIPFAHLDTLIISAIRSEGEWNLGMDLNLNTLRALGVYRYLNQRYRVTPEEFAAFMHHLTPYATGDAVPLFDQVFNPVALFDTPLVLDQKPFSAEGSEAASKKTVVQLCAGLGLQPTESSLFRLSAQTALFVGPLHRDLETVSSLYRQARIPKLFGLSPEEGWALSDLLGGVDYHRALCTGRLAPPVLSHSHKPLLVSASDSANGLSIRLALVLNSEDSGDYLRLLPGSELWVDEGDDFENSGISRVFTLLRLPAAPDVLELLRDPTGTGVLTLLPLKAGQSVSLVDKRISRAGWDAFTQQPERISYMRVKCGSFPNRDLSIKDIAWGDSSRQPPDILDVLMQMDWAVTWLKDSKQSVTQVRQLLGLDPSDYLPPEGLTDRLSKLAGDTRAVLITEQMIQALNLPTHEKSAKSRAPGAPISWPTVLLPLLDEQGLVKAFPLEVVDNTQAQLQVALAKALKPLDLDNEVRSASLEKLGTLLLNGRDRQLRLIEGLVQELSSLPMDRVQAVVHWAQTTVYQLLSLGLSDATPTLIEYLKTLLRHALAALHLGLSTRALRLFLVRSEWLGGHRRSPTVMVQFLFAGTLQPVVQGPAPGRRRTAWLFHQCQPDKGAAEN